MQVLYRCCCGLDVHAKTVVACLIKDGKKQTRTFSTMTDDLLALSDWLLAAGCTHAAVESTGVYWKPVFNILEGSLEVVLVNARHAKAVPGRKTDVRDCEWLADLLRHGLLRPSFIPPPEIRELRELTRYRQTLVREQTALANRVQKLIESANLKLGQVATDVLGVSGRLILRALADGETDATRLAQLARGRLRRKAVKLLQTIPGVGARVAEVLASEMGVDMTRFPTDAHLASWAGMCPGNNESGGKRLSGKTNKGSTHLRDALIQAAWVASHTKQTYLAAQYRRLVRRKGQKRALVAVGHSILVIAYHILNRRAGYEELGGDYFDRQSTERLQRQLIRRLERLGLKVVVEPMAEAA
jgi:transposase